MVDGYLIWLTAPESDLVVAYGAITSGTLLDCVIGEEKQISKTKVGKACLSSGTHKLPPITSPNRMVNKH